jgi:hypothetical protein
MVAVVLTLLAQTIDPPAKAPTGLLLPFLVIVVAVIVLIVVAALIRRAVRGDE